MCGYGKCSAGVKAYLSMLGLKYRNLFYSGGKLFYHQATTAIEFSIVQHEIHPFDFYVWRPEKLLIFSLPANLMQWFLFVLQYFSGLRIWSLFKMSKFVDTVTDNIGYFYFDIPKLLWQLVHLFPQHQRLIYLKIKELKWKICIDDALPVVWSTRKRLWSNSFITLWSSGKRRNILNLDFSNKECFADLHVHV